MFVFFIHNYLIRKLTVFAFLLLFNPDFSSAQNTSGYILIISGRVMLNDATQDHVKISIFRENLLVDSIVSGPLGKFKYALKVNSYYSISFDNSDGYHKVLAIDTNIPADIKSEIKPYKCIIRLDAEYIDDGEGAKKYSDFPIGIVKFDEESKMFELDYHYSRSRIKEIK